MGVKHSEATKQKISETLKRKGIKPTVLPSKEQCLKNLKKAQAKGVWNKGKKGLQIAWNKGFPMAESTKNKLRDTFFAKGSIPWNARNGKICIDCGKSVSRHKYKRCNKCASGLNKGKNHYNWKGGAKTEIIKTRSSIEYKAWRLDVYSRDWFACQMPECGYKGKNIEAHHVKKVQEVPELILDINNGITLCKECHLFIRNKEKDFEKLFLGIIKSYMAIRE